MSTVTVRDLRNKSADVLARVAHGETLTVTRDGEPIAQLGPLPRRRLRISEVQERFRSLPPLDAQQLREDLDAAIDPDLDRLLDER